MKRTGLFLATICLAINLTAQSDSTVLNSLKKADAYLYEKGESLSPYMAVFIPYLEKKYSRKLLVPVHAILDKPLQSADEKEDLPFLKRLVYDHIKTDSFTFDALKDYQQLMFYPILFRKKGPVKLYWDRIEQFRKDSLGYGVTHTLLSLEWALERKCIPKNKRLKELREWHHEKLVELIESTEGMDDLRIEAMAILGNSAGGKALKKEWINDLVNAQKENGGWSFLSVPGIKQSGNDHTTVLAIWALLAYLNPDAPETKWFP